MRLPWRKAPRAGEKVGKTRKWLKIGGEVVLVFVVYLGLRAYMQQDMAEGPAPGIDAVSITGTPVRLSDYRGEPVLVHFWATWCSICRLEQPGIQSIQADWPVLTIAMQSGDATEIQRYLTEQGLDWRVVADEDGHWARQFGVRGVPANFILDGKGRIRFRESGYSTTWGLRARLWLASR